MTRNHTHTSMTPLNIVKWLLSRNIRQVMLMVVLIVAVAPLGATAKPGNNGGPGNSDAAEHCRQGGFKNWMDAYGNSFKNAGQCTSYAAKGNTLIPVGNDPLPPNDPPPTSTEAILSISFGEAEYSEEYGWNVIPLYINGSGLLSDSAVAMSSGESSDSMNSIPIGLPDSEGQFTFSTILPCDATDFSHVYVEGTAADGSVVSDSSPVTC